MKTDATDAKIVFSERLAPERERMARKDWKNGKCFGFMEVAGDFFKIMDVTPLSEAEITMFVLVNSTESFNFKALLLNFPKTYF